MRIIIFSLILMFSSATYAGGTATGRILGVIPYSTSTEEVLIIKVENLSGTPACNTTSQFAITESHPRYKNTHAAALAAYMGGITITVKGHGVCTSRPNAEDMDYMCLGNTSCTL